MQANRAVNERASSEKGTCTIDKNRTDRRFLLGSFGRRVAWVGGCLVRGCVDAWVRGCVGARPARSERVRLRVLAGVIIILPVRCGFRIPLGWV